VYPPNFGRKKLNYELNNEGKDSNTTENVVYKEVFCNVQ
jgi:hypothetical protein